jgi:hypothetical protein
MDTGKNRSGADCFDINGVEYSACMAASIKMIINIDENRFRGSGLRITNSEMLEWYNSNPSLLGMIKKASQLSIEFSRILSPSWIASLMFIFSRTSITDSEDFMRKLCTGLDLSVNSPIYILRKKLLDDKVNAAKLPIKDRIGLMIKAWNLHRKGASCKIIRWDKNTERFPTPL